MKKWTVMFVPQGLGTTRTVELGIRHVYGACALAVVFLSVLAALSFSSAYLFQRHHDSLTRIRDIERQMLEAANHAEAKSSAMKRGLAEQERAEIERRVREEYESTMTAILADLNDLYDEDARIRKTRNLPPRAHTAADYLAEVIDEDGKGGPPGLPGDGLGVSVRDELAPAQVIYGMSDPSADLILQEIRLRRESLAELHEAMLAQRDREERMPTEWPVLHRSRTITSRFGWRKDPFNKSLRHHDGTDIGAPYGTPIHSAGRGSVIFSGFQKYYGHVVRIDHGVGYVTVYAHLSKRLVEEGQTVERGDVIGKLGSSGRSTGPHLHYEIQVEGKPTDAEEFLP